MSGFQGADKVEGGVGFTELGLANLGSELSSLLLAEDIVPGSPGSYQLCKTLFVAHPLGRKMAEKPVTAAQSQEREISVPDGPENLLVPAFKREWKSIGTIGADTWIANTKITSRIYGIASIMLGDRRNVGASDTPLDLTKLHEIEPYFNIFDPLNTSGSLVLDQDPNSPDFQKPRGVRVGAITYHPSRCVVAMNELPIYIEWNNAAFGFVGQSVYRRALFPMKTFLQSMVTDQWITLKVGLLVAKMKAPGNIVNKRILEFFGIKRSQLKAGITGNVLSIGHDENIESLNFQNLEGPAKFARDNSLKNTAMAAGMPSKMLEEEEMIGGMAEGTEDAKQIAQFVNRTRAEMDPLYSFFDRIVQRRAWSPEFYVGVQKQIKEYAKIPYETAFYLWSNSFTATWPNLLEEPDSQKVETEKARFESAVAVTEVLVNMGLDPETKASVAGWLANEVNSRRDLFSARLDIDERKLATYEPPTPPALKEPEPEAFSTRT